MGKMQRVPSFDGSAGHKRKAGAHVSPGGGGGSGSAGFCRGGRQRSSGGGGRRAWIPHDEETSIERAGVIRAEAFAAARQKEIQGAAAVLPALVRSADALACAGAPPARMPLRRRAASFRPYTMPLSVRLNPRKKRRVLSGAGVVVLCRASLRAVRRLASRQGSLSPERRGLRWLATHLWHTKRMKMGAFYGHRVALARADAGERAAVRWARKDATIHDESYCACLELSAVESDLLRLLREVAPGSAALSADSRAGGREDEIMLLEAESPRRAIAPARVLWRPAKPDQSRTLWLWTHPAAVDQVQSELAAVVCAHRLGIKCADAGVEMSRFQVRGPMSHVFVSAVLRPGESADPLHRRKQELWQGICVNGPAACVGRGDAFMVTCMDPRTLSPLPHQRSQAGRETVQGRATWPRLAAGAAHQVSAHDQDLCDGPLWSAEGRRRAAVPDSALHLWRHGGLVTRVPTDVHAGDKEAAGLATFPALLVRVESRPHPAMGRGHRGQRKLPKGKAGAVCGVGGWDLVLPRRWALVVWVALVKCGCRALALRESLAVEMERGGLCFPRDYPDTAAFGVWAHTTFEEQRSRFVSPTAPLCRPTPTLSAILVCIAVASFHVCMHCCPNLTSVAPL